VLNVLRENAPKVEATALLENNVLTLKFLAENAASEINICRFFGFFKNQNLAMAF